MTKHFYNELVDYLKNEFGGLVLCNNILDVDSPVYGNTLYGSNWSKERIEEGIDIYQYYLFRAFGADIQQELLKRFPDIIISYSEKLDLDILCVPYCGMPWNCIPIVINNL